MTYSYLIGFTKSGSAVTVEKHPLSGTTYWIKNNPKSLGRQIPSTSLDKYVYERVNESIW